MSFFAILKATLLPIALLAFSGCFSVNGEHTYWGDAYEPIHEVGPGTEDARFEQYSYNKYQSDDGKSISIGLFPGFIEIWREKDSNKLLPNEDDVSDWVAKTIACNCLLLGSATISSLLLEPFNQDSTPFLLSKFGLIGCYRWQEAPVETIVLKKTKEERIIRAREGADFHDVLGPTSQSMDRTKFYFNYPGFDQVISCVREKGGVDVLFDDGSSVRRFSKAKYVKNALVYKDWDVSDDTRLKSQVDFILRCRALKRRLQTAVTLERNSDKSNFIKASISEVDDALVSNAISDQSYRDSFDERMKEISKILEGKASAPAPTPVQKPSSSDNYVESVEKSEFDL